MSTFCISTRKESKEIHLSNFGGSGGGVVEWKQLCARLQRKLPTGQLEREPERHRLAYQLWHGSVAPESEKKTWFIIRTQFAIIGLGGAELGTSSRADPPLRAVCSGAFPLDNTRYANCVCRCVVVTWQGSSTQKVQEWSLQTFALYYRWRCGR